MHGSHHCVVEQTVNRVAVVLIVLGSVDTALSSDRVSAARRVLYAEVQHVEAHLAQAGCCTGTCQTRTYDDNVELQLVLRVNQALMCLIVGPFFSYRTFRYSGIYLFCHNILSK